MTAERLTRALRMTKISLEDTQLHATPNARVASLIACMECMTFRISFTLLLCDAFVDIN